MHLLRLLYDMLLIVLYVVTFTMAFVVYLIKKHHNCKVSGILFSIFALDHLIISLTELDTGFAFGYEKMFLMVPSWKTLIYTGSFLCMLLLTRDIMENKKRDHLSVLLVFMIVIMLFIPALPNSALKSWIYFFPSQIYLLLFSIIGLRGMKEAPGSALVHKFPVLKNMLKVTAVFSVLIVIEDTYVIFFQDEYTDFVNIQMRSYTEDIMRMILALMSIAVMISILKKEEQQSAGEAVSISTGGDSEVVFLDHTKGTDDKEEEAAAPLAKEPLEEFAEAYFLTGREKEIFDMMLKNMTNQEISEVLMISLGTAKTHTHNIFSKINVSNRREAIRLYQTFEREGEK